MGGSQICAKFDGHETSCKAKYNIWQQCMAAGVRLCNICCAAVLQQEVKQLEALGGER